MFESLALVSRDTESIEIQRTEPGMGEWFVDIRQGFLIPFRRAFVILSELIEIPEFYVDLHVTLRSYSLHDVASVRCVPGVKPLLRDGPALFHARRQAEGESLCRCGQPSDGRCRHRRFHDA